MKNRLTFEKPVSTSPVSSTNLVRNTNGTVTHRPNVICIITIMPGQ